MRILIACEFSGRVRDAFIKKGHDAWSCDLEPCLGNHIQDDVLNHIYDNWDLMIAHPPCTHLCVSGARYFKYKEDIQEDALEFVCDLMAAPIFKIAIENPIGILSTRIGKPTQIIQPWMFGETECKATCLWLKNLPQLIPTNIRYKRTKIINNLSPNKNRSKLRSITFKGIAEAMAEQWDDD